MMEKSAYGANKTEKSCRLGPAAGSMKAQLMTLITLLIFLLMLAEIFTLALININQNTISQSVALQSFQTNYGKLLRQSADSFASRSASQSLTTLINYEYNASLRKGNFVANASQYLSDLMINGVLPNETTGYTQNAMANLTLESYNTSLARTLNIAAQNLTINETMPFVYQPNAYSIGVRYAERVFINASGTSYRFNIPVNVSVPLNGTYDLFYAQQGALRKITFFGSGNLTSVIGNAYATSGNNVGFAYGTVYWVASSSSSSAACSSLPSQTTYLPIIVTYNAQNLGGCINNYAGLITYEAPASVSVPYLVYNTSSHIVSQLTTGSKVLLYGPGFDTLNIENLRKAVTDNYYFASPFTPSYLQRSSSDFMQYSQQGMFDFMNYGQQALSIGPGQGYVTAGGFSAPNSITISLWFKPTAFSGNEFPLDSNPSGIWRIGFEPSSSNNIVFDPDTSSAVTIPFAVNSESWYNLVLNAYDSGASTKYLFYMNGNLISSGSVSGVMSNSVNDIVLGNEYSSFNGEISNVQIYDSNLSASQIFKLYLNGISGLPISNANIIEYLPLNGNANDLSGTGANGAVTNAVFVQATNYSRDSIFSYPVSTALSPIPGILWCDTNAECASNSQPHLFVGSNPVEIGNRYLEVANFTQTSSTSNIVSTVTGTNLTPGGYNTAAFWMDWNGVTGEKPVSFGSYSILMSSVSCFGFDSSGTDVYGSSANTLGRWTFVAAIFYNGIYTSNSMIYVNGVQQSLTQCAGSANTPLISDSVTIGPLSSYLANVQLYRSKLTSAQIQDLYSRGPYGTPIVQNLTAWYPLQGNANDYSGYGNNGTASSAITYPYIPAGSVPFQDSESGLETEMQFIGLSPHGG